MTTPEQFADTIRAAWRGTTQNVLDAAKAAAEARKAGVLYQAADLLAGTVDKSTLTRLAIIGDYAPFYEPGAAQHLPHAWGTLYELTKLDRDVVRTRLGHEITPAIARTTVGGWLPPRTTRAKPPPEPIGLPTLAQALADGTAILRSEHERILADALAVAAASAPRTPTTIDGLVDVCANLRKSGKPADYIGQVKPAQLMIAIKFLEAVRDAKP